jgi:hypothetical protein
MTSPREATAREELTELFDSLLDAYLAHGEVRTVLRAQLEGALDTSDQMAERLIEEARSTYASAANLASFMEGTGERAAQSFARMHAAIASADAVESLVLEERARRLYETGENSRKTLGQQARLEALGEKAHGLGMRIRIVAMNTSIEATRSSGKSGTTIGVLAREIAGLAVEVQRLGIELKDAVQTMSSMLNRDLVEGVQTEVLALSDVRRTLAVQVRELQAACEELDSFRRNVWDEVSGATKQICDVASAMSGIQYQDVLRQRLVQVVGVLIKLADRDEVLRQALRGEGSLPEDWRPLALGDLAQEYVMSAQRDAHGRAAGQAEPAPEPSALPEIELF